VTDETSVADDSTEEVETPGRTAEEVELEWRNRVSQKDKAHAQELARLQAELTKARETASTATSRGSEQMTDNERLAQEKADLERQLQDERSARVIEVRQAKYPTAVASVGEDAAKAMDDEKLAALETRLATPAAKPPSVMDANQASRTPSEPPAEKTSDDLKADLERLAPEFVSSL
jgi:hypothetical protein